MGAVLSPSDTFKKMFAQRYKEMEKQYNLQVKELKKKKASGQSSKKAVSTRLRNTGSDVTACLLFTGRRCH